MMPCSAMFRWTSDYKWYFFHIFKINPWASWVTYLLDIFKWTSELADGNELQVPLAPFWTNSFFFFSFQCAVNVCAYIYTHLRPRVTFSLYPLWSHQSRWSSVTLKIVQEHICLKIKPNKTTFLKYGLCLTIYHLWPCKSESWLSDHALRTHRPRLTLIRNTTHWNSIELVTLYTVLHQHSSLDLL